MDIAAIKLRSITVSTGSPPMCRKHGVFMITIWVETDEDVKMDYECRICRRIITDEIQTLTREVLFEKYDKWAHIKQRTAKQMSEIKI